MTKPEAVTQEADSGFTPENIADAEWFWTMLPVFTKWGSLKTYEKAAAIHTVQRFRQAAEQRGAKREMERCLREAEDADPLGKDAFGMREYIAQAIRQGEQA